MDRQEGQKLVDQGGMLRLALPAATRTGPDELAQHMREWLAEAAAIDGSPETKHLLPAVQFLKAELEQRLQILATMKHEE